MFTVRQTYAMPLFSARLLCNASMLLMFLALVLVPGAKAQLPPGAQDATAAPTDSQGRLRAEANEALEKGNYRRALGLLTSVLEQASPDEHDAHLLYDLAYTQDALDQTSNAEASYHRAIAADPNLIEAHLGLGLLLARTARAADGRAELATAAQLTAGPPALRARALRALARLDLQTNPAAARDELLAALRLSPETPDDTLMAAELAESAKNPAEAEKAYRRALADSPNDPATTAALAHLLARQNPVEAETLLNGALQAHPGDAALSAQLATLYAMQGKYTDALPLAETLHLADPTDRNLTLLLAHLYSESGAPEKADPLYAALLSEHADPVLLDDRAEALIQLRRYAEAEALLKRAVADPKAFPTREDLGSAASHLAFAASNNNDPSTSLRALELRATVLPQSPSSLFLAAIAHDKLREYKVASDLYRQFLAVAGGKFPDEEFEARHRLIAIEKLR